MPDRKALFTPSDGAVTTPTLEKFLASEFVGRGYVNSFEASLMSFPTGIPCGQLRSALE